VSILYRPPVTWELLIAHEPRLSTASTVEEIGRLVGWSANTLHPLLCSSDAYHVALDKLIAGGEQASARFQIPALEACV
jgi:hypothetical protein